MAPAGVRVLLKGDRRPFGECSRLAGAANFRHWASNFPLGTRSGPKQATDIPTLVSQRQYTRTEWTDELRSCVHRLVGVKGRRRRRPLNSLGHEAGRCDAALTTVGGLKGFEASWPGQRRPSRRQVRAGPANCLWKMRKI